MKPVIIEVGLNEAVSREQNPWVPNAPGEIAADILECAAAGASVIHFHARDPETGEQRCSGTELYRQAIREVRDAGCDVLVYPTYEPFFSGEGDVVAERFGHVLALADDPRLDMRIGPLDMGSLNFAMASGGALLPGNDRLPLEYSVYANPLPVLKRMLEEYDRRDLIVSLAIFEPGHLRATLALLALGFGRHPLLKFILSDGWLHGPLADPEGLGVYVRMLKRLQGEREIEWICAPSGIESPQAVESLLRAALEQGGHVRVGVGDTPAAAGGQSNRKLVEQVVALGSGCGRPPATAKDVRRLFGQP